MNNYHYNTLQRNYEHFKDKICVFIWWTTILGHTNYQDQVLEVGSFQFSSSVHIARWHFDVLNVYYTFAI